MTRFLGQKRVKLESVGQFLKKEIKPYLYNTFKLLGPF